MKDLTLDSSPADKIRALLDVAEHSDAGIAHLIARDKDENIVSAIYAEGEDAVALAAWLKRRESRTR